MTKGIQNIMVYGKKDKQGLYFIHDSICDVYTPYTETRERITCVVCKYSWLSNNSYKYCYHCGGLAEDGTISTEEVIRHTRVEYSVVEWLDKGFNKNPPVHMHVFNLQYGRYEPGCPTCKVGRNLGVDNYCHACGCKCTWTLMPKESLFAVPAPQEHANAFMVDNTAYFTGVIPEGEEGRYWTLSSIPNYPWKPVTRENTMRGFTGYSDDLSGKTLFTVDTPFMEVWGMADYTDCFYETFIGDRTSITKKYLELKTK